MRKPDWWNELWQDPDNKAYLCAVIAGLIFFPLYIKYSQLVESPQVISFIQTTKTGIFIVGLLLVGIVIMLKR